MLWWQMILFVVQMTPGQPLLGGGATGARSHPQQTFWTAGGNPRNIIVQLKLQADL